MREFKLYRVVNTIDYVVGSLHLANFWEERKFLSERQAINFYKDGVWNTEGLFNNTIAKDDGFIMTGTVTLYGITPEDDYVIIRTADFQL